VLPEPEVFVNVASIDTTQHRTSLRVWDLPEGALRKEDSAPEVYLIRNRCKTWVESPDVLLKVLGRSWADVRSVPDGGLAGAGWHAPGSLLGSLCVPRSPSRLWPAKLPSRPSDRDDHRSCACGSSSS
jgi:hypothetical protein